MKEPKVVKRRPYQRPAATTGTASIPRLVNPQWVMLALRDQARAATRGEWLPWDSAGLLRRAAAVIELHIVRRRPS